LLRRVPRGEINPQSPFSVHGDEYRVSIRSCSSLLLRLFSMLPTVY
jgi:hypothetical protein